MNHRIEPAGHRVLLKVVKPEEKTAGGLYLPKSAAEKLEASSEVGEVCAIGSTAFLAFDPQDRWGIEVGQKVFFVRQGGKVIPSLDPTEVAKDMYRIVNDEDIIGIIREVD